MKQVILILVLVISLNCSGLFAQNETQVYDPNANPRTDIENALKKAKSENKHVILQIGGNWCPWCIMLHNFVKENHRLDSIMNADYVAVKVNYDKKNKDMQLMKELDYPQRFGFPVLVILDADGKRLHTQNTVYLEEGKGYNEKRVFDFLKAWNPAALSPETY